MMNHDSSHSHQEDGEFNFDKFMDAILIEEARFRADRPPVADESPQRRRARLRQERPLGRTYVRPGRES